MSKIYAGIGSRQTPIAIQFVMIHIAAELAARGWTLRSGAAEGADQAFERGCDRVDGQKQIFVPWYGFNERVISQPGVICGYNEYTEDIAARFHPNWSACSNGAKALHSRNVCQVLGFSRDNPSDMIICWTPNASGSGGTGQALRIAKHYNVPVYDLGDESVLATIIKDLNLNR